MKILLILMLTLTSLIFAQSKDNPELNEVKGQVKDAYKENRDLKSIIRNYKKLEKLEKEKVLLLKEKDCVTGNTKSCTELGMIHYENGKFKKAEKVWKANCEKDFESCALLGNYYQSKRRKRQAIEYLRKACKKDDKNSCNNLAILYYQTGKKDLSIQLNEELCGRNYAGSCFNLGKIFESKNENIKAFGFYHKACDLDYPKACEENKATIKTYERLCNAGNLVGCVVRGHFAFKAKDYKVAYHFYKLSCDKNISVGCFNLGHVAFKDNIKSAKSAWEKGCELKDRVSCLYGAALDLNPSFFNNLALQLKSYCDKGDGESCYHLGMGYAIKADTKRGSHFLEQSLISGYDDWKKTYQTSILLKLIRESAEFKKIVE